MRIAVIGSGISGLGAAWALAKAHDVTIYEAQSRPGGHSNTVEVATVSGRTAVDTGFIVYNPMNYPHLVRLFDALSVPNEASEMSFSVSLDGGAMEYSGSTLGLFAQARNLVSRRHWRMLRDLTRFYREATALLEPGDTPDISLGEYLDRNAYSAAFIEDHLLPMAAAIWSCPAREIRAFPARSFVQFMQNHGLLLISGRPQWRTVTGGSREYVRRMTAGFGDRLRLATPVRALRRDAAGVEVVSDSDTQRFDEVVLATHGDQALAILGESADPMERNVLSAFTYARNDAILHGDKSLMPKRRAVWSSWNYLGKQGESGDRAVSVTYWMNRLQNLGGDNLFLSLNPLQEPAAEQVHERFTYDHPIFDAGAIAAQAGLPGIQGARRTWFCGSYCGYGFHEDALESGLAVAAALGAEVPWAAETRNASPAAAIAPRRAPSIAQVAAE